MIINLPKKVEKLIEIAAKHGENAYAVGGCVRDLIMGKEPKDYDITISCSPTKTKEIYKEFKTFDTGIKYGTVSVLWDNDIFEITTFRTDKEYEDKRHPKVLFTNNVKEDLVRRDFTINALAYNKKEGLLDFYKGKEDIKKRIIKAVGNSKERFDEDPLRILRALRFASTLEFTIEKETKKGIFEMANLLEFVSGERKKTELDKLLLGNCEKILKEYKDVITRCADIGNYDRVIKYAENTNDLAIKWCVLLSESENVKTLAENLKFSKDLKKLCLVTNKENKKELKKDLISIKFLVKEYGIDLAKKIIEFKKAKGENVKEAEKNIKTIKEQNLCCTLKQLKISGKDLIEKGYKEKEKYSKILDNLLNLVIEEKCENEKEELIKRLG